MCVCVYVCVCVCVCFIVCVLLCLSVGEVVFCVCRASHACVRHRIGRVKECVIITMIRGKVWETLVINSIRNRLFVRKRS